MLIYKVVEIKQRSFARGYMTAQDLQNTINQWASLGWELDRINAGETQGFLHAKDVFLLIFKVKVEIPEGFHLMVNGQPIGPLSLQQAWNLYVQGQLNPQTPACKLGMDGWHPLGSVAPTLNAAMFS